MTNIEQKLLVAELVVEARKEMPEASEWQIQHHVLCRAIERYEALSAKNERLREALKKPKAWLVSDGKTYWATVFEPYPKDHPHCDIIPLYSAPLGETK